MSGAFVVSGDKAHEGQASGVEVAAQTAEELVPADAHLFQLVQNVCHIPFPLGKARILPVCDGDEPVAVHEYVLQSQSAMGEDGVMG